MQRLWRRLFSRLPRTRRETALQVEVLESRQMMASNPLHLGSVYIEDDTGADHAGDTFEVSFVGGAPGTTLQQLVIDGDQDRNGLGRGDAIFDTAPTGLGADQASPFEIVSLETADARGAVTASVADGATRLVLDFQHFQAGDRLVFRIDVDEIELWDGLQTDVTEINEGIDPVTSGVEFHGSLLAASFAAPHYEDAAGETIFRNRYDAELDGTGLFLTPDDDNGRRDRTAGGVITLQQQVKPARISGSVYHDRNLNGMRDEGEEGIAGVPVQLVPVQTVEPQSVLTVQTDVEGRYAFDQVMPGEYQVIEVEQPSPYWDGEETVGTVDGATSGAVRTGGDAFVSVFLAGGSTGVDYDFGEYLPVQIAGTVGLSNHDGACDTADESLRLADVRITLHDELGTLIDETRTDSQGAFAFRDLPPGRYEVREWTPAEYFDGPDEAGHVEGSGVRTLAGNDLVTTTLSSGSALVGLHFCEHPGASISGFVYHDRNDDGQRDVSSEEPIAGTTVLLVDQDGRQRSTVTDDAGVFAFVGLPAGLYRLVEQQPVGWLDGQETLGSVDGALSGVIGSDRFEQIALDWGSQGVLYGFGELLPGSIAGQVWGDPDGDCRERHDGQPLRGVRIQLLNSAGDVVAETLTDEQGRYGFGGLLPGVYQVVEIQPADWLQGDAHVGDGGGVLGGSDLLSDIVVTSGATLNDYDFCEVPPAKISGFVYRDGDVVVSVDGRLPDDLATIRDGLRTADDRPLPGVVLELRHGLTGDPIPASWALPGLYAGDEIRTTTDEFGYYEFDGLPPGLYSVYEVHPRPYIDGIDHAGTTAGIAINPHDPASLSIATQLTVDPQNDAIVRIALPAGEHSRENNFSEVEVRRVVVLPPTPLPFRALPEPPLTPRVASPPSAPLAPFVGFGQPNYDFDPSHASMAYTWHLSIINGGNPRDEGRVEVGSPWYPASWLSTRQWNSEQENQGEWLMVSAPTTTSTPVGLGFHLGRSGVIPIAGDFNGDGVDEVGFFDEGDWYLDVNGSGTWDEDDLWARLGGPGDLPVVGDWDGDGKDDIGIFGPEWRRDRAIIPHDPGVPDVANDRQLAEQVAVDGPKNVPPNSELAAERARLMQRAARGEPKAHVIDHVFAFGNAGAIPIAGDFNGDGISTIGTFHHGRWFLDADGDGRRESTDVSVQFGQPGDLPVVGDFNGDGVAEIGIYRNGTWIIDSNGNHRVDRGDQVIQLGSGQHLPVVADTDGDGVDEPLVYRPSVRP